MTCRWIRQGCIVSLVQPPTYIGVGYRGTEEMACRWTRQGCIISLVRLIRGLPARARRVPPEESGSPVVGEAGGKAVKNTRERR